MLSTNYTRPILRVVHAVYTTIQIISAIDHARCVKDCASYQPFSLIREPFLPIQIFAAVLAATACAGSLYQILRSQAINWGLRRSTELVPQMTRSSELKSIGAAIDGKFRAEVNKMDALLYSW